MSADSGEGVYSRTSDQQVVDSWEDSSAIGDD